MIVLDPSQVDWAAFDVERQMRMSFQLFERMLLDEETQKTGYVYLETFRNVSFWQCIKMSSAVDSSTSQVLMSMIKVRPFLIRLRFPELDWWLAQSRLAWRLGLLQDVMPMRLRAIYVTEQPFLFSIIWAIVSPFLSKKLRTRIHLLGTNMEPIHELVGRENVPPDFGGTFEESEDWFTQVYGQAPPADAPTTGTIDDSTSTEAAGGGGMAVATP